MSEEVFDDDSYCETCFASLALACPNCGPEWRPIETAPKDGTTILGLEMQSILGEELMRLPIRWTGHEWHLAWTEWYDGEYSCTPTHWMPLPPPKGAVT